MVRHWPFIFVAGDLKLRGKVALISKIPDLKLRTLLRCLWWSLRIVLNQLLQACSIWKSWRLYQITIGLNRYGTSFFRLFPRIRLYKHVNTTGSINVVQSATEQIPLWSFLSQHFLPNTAYCVEITAKWTLMYHKEWKQRKALQRQAAQTLLKVRTRSQALLH